MLFQVAYQRPWSASLAGGRERIRTSGGVAPTPDFESGAFNHSATLPSVELRIISHGWTFEASCFRTAPFLTARYLQFADKGAILFKEKLCDYEDR